MYFFSEAVTKVPKGTLSSSPPFLWGRYRFSGRGGAFRDKQSIQQKIKSFIFQDLTVCCAAYLYNGQLP
jgi:hypothetical protein